MSVLLLCRGALFYAHSLSLLYIPKNFIWKLPDINDNRSHPNILGRLIYVDIQKKHSMDIRTSHVYTMPLKYLGLVMWVIMSVVQTSVITLRHPHPLTIIKAVTKYKSHSMGIRSFVIQFVHSSKDIFVFVFLIQF